MANTKFTRAVKKAKGLYKSGRYKTFADAVKAAYKKIPGKRSKPRTVKKSRRRVAAIKTQSRTHTDYNKPEVNISIGSLQSQLRSKYRDRLATQLLRREETKKKLEKRRINKLISQTRQQLRKLS